MRPGIANTLQQMLTTEAAAVLRHAMADAQRRGHAQVTPLHVASSLLNSPSGMLQQACLQSHRHMQHPLQCRALDLCFNVALDRLPVSSSSSSGSAAGRTTPNRSSEEQVSMSNALVAALKRAQAHQRRGCPEQQQVPLLAVKVEMEQLVISILDDPSVSRVMREAGFSSTSAKSSLESMAAATATAMVSTISVTPLATRPTMVTNGSTTGRDADSILGIMLASRRKCNPVVIGDDVSTSGVVQEVWRRIDQRLGSSTGVRIVNMVDYHGDALVSMVKVVLDHASVVVFLGNLSWCLEGGQGGSPHPLMVELVKMATLCSASKGRLWYLGVATSATYTRFLAHFPSMEASLGFQPLPISSGNTASLRPRFSQSQKDEVIMPGKLVPKLPFQLMEEPVPPDELSCCSDCNAKFEQEKEHKSESVHSSTGESLPLWMKDKRPSVSMPQFQQQRGKEQMVLESRRKWSRICHILHSSSKKSCSASLPNLLNDSTSSSSQTSSGEGRPKVKRIELRKPTTASWLSLSTATEQLKQEVEVTGLSLGSKSVLTDLSLAGAASPGSSVPSHHQTPRDTSDDEVSMFKKLYTGLRERVPWQPAAASKVASTVVQCRSGESENRGAKCYTWMVFNGADRMGKRNLGKELARLVFGSEDEKFALLSLSGRPPFRWCGNDGLDSPVINRGRTVLHRLGEVLCRTKSHCVVVLEDLDEADINVKRALARSMECGKFLDSTGREVSLGNAVLILSTSSSNLEERIFGLECCDVKLEFGAQAESGCGEVALVEHRPVGETVRLLTMEKQIGVGVGEKRKSGWRRALSKVFEQRSNKAVALDLNLGLSSSDEVQPSSCFGGLDVKLVDQVVEFEQFDFEVAAEYVMEKLEGLASDLGVGLHLDIRCLENMVGATWEDRRSFEAWLQQPCLVSALAHCSRGSVLQLRPRVSSGKRSFLGDVLL